MLDRKRFMPLVIWLYVTLFYCYQYILRLIPNSIMPELISKFNIGAKEFGSFAGIYYLGYITMHIPVGILFSRFGVKKILPIFIASAAIGMAPIIYSTNWQYVVIGRLLVGLGSTAAIIAAFQLFRTIFPFNYSRVLGSMVCVGLLTAVYINIPLSNMVNNVGVERVINILIILGLALAGVSFLLLPKQIKENNNTTIITDLMTIASNYKLIIVAILAGLMVGPMEGFADAWGSAFINNIYGIERSSANYIVSFILTGMCIGSIVLPFIADKTQASYGVTIFSAISMIFSFGFLLFKTSISSNLLILICLNLGICSAYQIVILSKMSSFVPEHLSGLAAAIGNMIIMAFGYIFHNVIGSFMEQSWSGVIVNGAKIYEPHSYLNSIAVIPIAIIIALVGFISLLIFERCNKKLI